MKGIRNSLLLALLFICSCENPIQYEVIDFDNKLYKNKIPAGKFDDQTYINELVTKAKNSLSNKAKYQELKSILSASIDENDHLLINGIIKGNNKEVDELVFYLGKKIADMEHRMVVPKGTRINRVYVIFQFQQNGWSYTVKDLKYEK